MHCNITLQTILPGCQGNYSLGVLLIRVHHAVQLCYIPLGVGNDGVGELGQVVVGLDVVYPAIKCKEFT